MTHATMNRRKALAAVAVAPAALAALPALGLCKDPTEGGDAELGRLWARYRLALAASNEARRVYREARPPYVAEYDRLKVLPEYEHRFGEMHRMLWKKHGLEPFADPSERAYDEVIAIVRAIRKAKAETVFGIGVKLAALEGDDEQDIVEAAEDALGAIGELIGCNFVAASGVFAEA